MQPDAGTRNPVTPVVEAGGMTGLRTFANTNGEIKIAQSGPIRHLIRSS
jgi:hypothetical protein